jgi:hypothetical protein
MGMKRPLPVEVSRPSIIARTIGMTVANVASPNRACVFAQRFHLDLSRTLLSEMMNEMRAADAAGCLSLLVSEQKTLLEVVSELINKAKNIHE